MSADNNEETLVLGTEFRINLEKLSRNETSYTVDQLITSLEGTSTLTDLTVEFGGGSFEARGKNSRRIVAPLCRCISNLRLDNAHYPLQKLKLCRSWLYTDSDRNEVTLDVIEQFLVAAKRFGIRHLKLHDLLNIPFPIQFILEFCRDNSRLRVLEMKSVRVSDSTAVVSWFPSDRPQGSSAIVHLDKLMMKRVHFTSATAASSFGNFLDHLSVAVMVLGSLEADDFEDVECRKIVSEFKIPSVEQLTLTSCCSHTKTALKAARATVTDLTVVTCCDNDCEIPGRYEELQSLARTIRRAAKLKSLLIEEHYHYRLRLPSRMIKAIDGCATITQFAAIHDIRPDLDRPLPLQLQRTLARNNELARFVASPSTYPTHSLPNLILQFDQCPSGRYMLVRRLPEVLSFEHLAIKNNDSLTTSRQQKMEE